MNQPEYDFHALPERQIIQDLETLRVIADPLRVRIIELTAVEPRTAKQLSSALGVPQTKIYYHLNLLEQHGILQVTGTRVVSGIIEKRYGPTAQSYTVDPELFSPGEASDSTVDLMLATITDSMRDGIRQGLASGLLDPLEQADPDRRLTLLRSVVRLDARRAAEFFKRLQELINEFGGPNAAERGGQLHQLTLVLFPIQDIEAD